MSELPTPKYKVEFFDSTVAITAYNVIALQPGPTKFDAISVSVRHFFGARVTLDPEQLLECLKKLEDKKLLTREEDEWNLVDPERRIIRRSVRPDPADPESGWEGLSFVKIDRGKLAAAVIAERRAAKAAAKKPEPEKG